MKKKNHGRAPGKRNFSVALPITLIEQIESIAESETRSRNRQIEHFLLESVKHAKKSERNTALSETEKQSESPGFLSMVAEDQASSLSTPALGAHSVKYPAARTRKKA